MADNFEGLIGVPAGDGNFTSGIQRMSDKGLAAFLDRLVELEATEGGHKGRIAAIRKELKIRGTNTPEMCALVATSQEIAAVERDFGDGQSYELSRLESEVRFYQQQAGAALLEMGRRLIVIKAHEEHGAFMESLERMGLAYRSAAYAMAAARKFANVPTWADLEGPKLKALTVLDEEDIKNLEDGKAVDGLGTLDEIERMTTRELREALRKERDKRKREKEAQERAIAQKEAKINELDQQLRYQQPPTKEQIAIAELARLTHDYTLTIAKVNGAIDEARQIINQAERIEGVNVQILSEWLNRFDADMERHHSLRDAWMDEVDNAGPIKDWRISDLPN
ncbi:MAG: hypothetical protein MdMp014T_3003 [Treponematales bacterium]